MAKRRLSRRQLERVRHIQQRRRDRSAQKAAEAAPPDAALGPEQDGLVTANYGPTLIVEAADGSLQRCALRQNIDLAVCGDRVVWQPSSPGEGVVVALAERRSLLLKPDYSGRLKPVAANVDQVAVVIAPQPPPSESLIDRYLVALQALAIDALLVINKVDLLAGTEFDALLARLATYRQIGYPLLSVSVRSKTGLDALRERLSGRASVLVGQSGVGKSSLIQALLPEHEIRTQALSAATGLGTHTTTTAMLYHLPAGGDLIDSPGVRSFEPLVTSAERLEHGFVEFAPYLRRCRFVNCRHDTEPDCALAAAAKAGEIDPRRLASFRQLRAALEEREKP